MKHYIQLDSEGNIIDSFTENQLGNTDYLRRVNHDILNLVVGQECKFTETTVLKRVE